jgi:hypothetical protein
VRAATFNDCAAIDDAWPSSRRPADVHHAWRWMDIAKSLKDCFVVAEGDRPVAICGHPPDDFVDEDTIAG